ncbi:hypothetical protein JYU02_00035 [bacterium AH-315-P15]|nr:hypothetical protein [bacterium AH-315-P15]
MFKSRIAFGALLLAVALGTSALAQSFATNRSSFVGNLAGTSYNDQQKYNFFASLRSQCDSARGDSVGNFRLGGGRSPTANINHTCARYTSCDGRVNVPGGLSFRFNLRCR